MMRILMAFLAAVIGIAVAFALVHASSWRGETKAAVARLESSNGAAAFDASALSTLPPPVARYLRKSLRDGQSLVRSATATQEAEFFINDAWRPLRATQHFRASPPAFVWDARIDMAPMLTAWVRDSYVDGRGGMQAAILGVYTLADQVDKPELNSGALQRFLGEAIWLPTALLPSPALSWAAAGEHAAIATLSDHGTNVSLRFEFDDTGMIQNIGGDRYQEASGTYSLQPWLIRCDEPREFSGMRIPVHCVVNWVVEGKPVPYWRGRVTSISYQFD